MEVLRGDRTAQQIAARHSLHPNQVSQWKRKASEGLVQLFERGRKSARDEREAEIRKLHEKIGQLVAERDFLICRAGHIKNAAPDPFHSSSDAPEGETPSGNSADRWSSARSSDIGVG